MVIDEADRVLKVAKFRVGLMAGFGPGLSSTSPAKSIMETMSRLLMVWFIRSLCGMRDFGLKMYTNGR